ncbi:hypothetical protein AGLY_008731, partial [Aphis glycines]
TVQTPPPPPEPPPSTRPVYRHPNRHRHLTMVPPPEPSPTTHPRYRHPYHHSLPSHGKRHRHTTSRPTIDAATGTLLSRMHEPMYTCAYPCISITKESANTSQIFTCQLCIEFSRHKKKTTTTTTIMHLILQIRIYLQCKFNVYLSYSVFSFDELPTTPVTINEVATMMGEFLENEIRNLMVEGGLPQPFNQNRLFIISDDEEIPTDEDLSDDEMSETYSPVISTDDDEDL